jgi:hypothetical protein
MARGLECRYHANHDGAEHRQREHVANHLDGSQGDVHPERRLHDQQVELLADPGGQRQAGGRGDRRKHQALHEHLGHDPPAAGAKRAADGDLVASCGGSRVHEHRDVGADDHQQQQDGEV